MFPRVALPVTHPVGIVIVRPDLPVASAGLAALQTCHVTAVFWVPATEALNCCVLVRRTVAEIGATLTTTLGDELPPQPAAAEDSARIVTQMPVFIQAVP